MPIQALKAIPEATAKEWVSVAYVEAITAQAGLNVKTCRWDDGIDIEVGSNKPLFGNHRFPNLYLSLQLKATENWEVDQDGSIKFRLKASNYDLLRQDTYFPRYLVLYTLPHSRAHWIVQRPELVEFRSCAFFANLVGSPELRVAPDGRRRASRSVKVPTANRFTAASLLRLYREACEKAVTLGGGA
jgi:hypothetical protein